MENILVIDDNPDIVLLLKRYLSKNGYEVETALTGESGLELFKKKKHDLVLCDFRLPDHDGLGMIQSLKSIDPSVQIVIITGYSDVKVAVNVMKNGAFEYVTKPIHPEEILHTIKDALRDKKERQNVVEGKTSKATFQKTKSKKTNSSNGTTNTAEDYLHGEGIRSKKLRKHVELVAPTEMTVIISGESGTGKEVTAKMIHEASERKDNPIVAVDCGAIPRDLAGSILFGHLKGSFTGALKDKIGHFEAADGGTLFLDEIGNLSYENQVKMLRVLQERKIQRIGDTNDINIDVRIIVATNEDLKAKVDKGEFREDLYYRLNEFSIDLPSLKEREEDLDAFCDFFLKKAETELNKSVKGIKKDVLKIFSVYDWPGNIRELKNVIKRATLMADGDYISLEDIPDEIKNPKYSFNSKKQSNLPPGEIDDLKSVAERAEKRAIMQTLRTTGFNKSKTADMLNIDRKTLYNKINSYGIELPS